MRLRFLAYVLLAALTPPIGAFMLTGYEVPIAEDSLEQRLTAANAALQFRVDAETARRRELLLRLVALSGIAGPVRDAAAAGLPPPAIAVTRLREAIAQLFSHDPPELLAVVTAKGAQVVVTGGAPQSVAAADLPTADAALKGSSSDTFARFKAGAETTAASTSVPENALYHFSGAPIGMAEGAIVIGDRLGDSSALRWRSEIRADATMAVGTTPVLSSLPKGNLPAELAKASLSKGITLKTGALDLGLPFGVLQSIFPLNADKSAYRSVAWDVGGATAIITIRSNLAWMGRAQLVGIVLGFIVFVVGLVWMWLVNGPVQRQARSIEAHLARLRVERSLRITTKGFSPPFTAIAQLLDKLADDWSKDLPTLGAAPLREAPPMTDAAPRPVIPRPPIDLPLSPTTPSRIVSSPDGTPSFPFADDPSVTATRNTKPVTAPKPTKDPAPPPVPPPAPVTAPAAATGTVNKISREFAPPKSRETAPREPAPEPKPAAPPTPTTTSKPASRPGSKRDGGTPRPAPAPGSADENGPVPLPAPTRASAPAPAVQDSDLPPDLLARSQELENELLESPSDGDEDHFKAVFEEFVTVRRRCGEANDGLTFDKFVARLKKNRDQLIEKYACKAVRFQVYVKEGKAAVKALPVR